MTTVIVKPTLPSISWRWPVDLAQYDRTPDLSTDERVALAPFLVAKRQRMQTVLMAEAAGGLERLIRPLRDVYAGIDGSECLKHNGIYLLLRMCAREHQAYWGWSLATWLQVLGTSRLAFYNTHQPGNATDTRQYVVAAAYLLRCFRTFDQLGGMAIEELGQKIFGRENLAPALDILSQVATTWGYSRNSAVAFRSTIVDVLLQNEHPNVTRITRPLLEQLHATTTNTRRRAMIYRLSRALAYLDIIPEPLPLSGGVPEAVYRAERERGIAPAWVAWVQRWFATSTRSEKTRLNMRRDLLRVGRWLAAHHPAITIPGEWTRELAAEFVAAVTQMRTGDFSCAPDNLFALGRGKPFSARRVHSLLGVMRRSFVDAQEWGWIERRFNPMRVFATPRALWRMLGPNPRVIDDDVWAKLLWAGLNIRPEDVPAQGTDRNRRQAAAKPAVATEQVSFYPIEMIRALAVVWLFSGLRSDEIVRLRVGCARVQQRAGESAPAAEQAHREQTVCLLDVPVHKTGRAFTKPVDPLVAEAIAAWEAVRPVQPNLLDRKTGESVQLLFCYRAKPLAKTYLNASLIPMLCRRAGVPEADARGSISSHRARSTIASQLFNAREPMTLFELQAWLGHLSPATTQHYVAQSPTKLANAYRDAGYFARNLRAIEVLVDQQAIADGSAAKGTPWRYYDLGHGWCSYEFFDQCPHRMACARCDFYVPKASTRGQVLEAKEGLITFLQEIPLSDDERAAVDGDVQALDRLLEKLKDVPTPSGGTPRRARVPVIPLYDVHPVPANSVSVYHGTREERRGDE